MVENHLSESLASYGVIFQNDFQPCSILVLFFFILFIYLFFTVKIFPLKILPFDQNTKFVDNINMSLGYIKEKTLQEYLSYLKQFLIALKKIISNYFYNIKLHCISFSY